MKKNKTGMPPSAAFANRQHVLTPQAAADIRALATNGKKTVQAELKSVPLSDLEPGRLKVRAR